MLKKLLAALLAAVFIFSLAACGDDGGDDEKTTTSDKESTESTDEGSAESTDEGSTESADEEATDTTEEDATGDSLGEMMDMDDCLEVSLTYGSLFLSLLGGSDADMADIEQSLEDIKGKVPSDIQDDLETIQEGFAGTDNIMEAGEYMDSDEFKEADENITTYLDEVCGG